MTKGELRELFLRYLDEATDNGEATSVQQRADLKDKFDYFLGGAMLFVAGQIKTVKEHSIHHAPPQNTCSGRGAVRVCEGTAVLEGTGKACYFEVFGSAVIRIYHNGLLIFTEINTGGFNAYKRFLNAVSAPVRMEFSGDFTYTIKNVAIYDEAISASSEDVPVFGKTVRYTMPADFRELKCVLREDGAEYTQFVRRGSHVIALPYQQAGEYTVRYYANPAAVTPLTPDSAVIDLPDKAMPLVALKTAYDASLCENPALSAWLKGIFDNELANSVSGEADGPRSVVGIYTLGG